MRMTKWDQLNEKLFMRKDCALGFNKEGMLKVVKEKKKKKDRRRTYYLGSVDGEQFYWKRKEMPRRRTNFFV